MRTAGVAVLIDAMSDAYPDPGNRVTVTGAPVLIGMEGMVVASDWTLDPWFYDLPNPVALCNKAVGGSTPMQPPLSDRGGLCTVGSRIRLFGKVTWVDNPNWPGQDAVAYIDDGSGLLDHQPQAGEQPIYGIRVQLTGNPSYGVDVGDYIAATGVLGIVYVDPDNEPQYPNGNEYHAYTLQTGDPSDWEVYDSQ